jgi:hypothetical protein
VPLRAGGSERLELLLADQRNENRHVRKCQLHLIAQDRGHHLGTALVGHVHEVDGGLRLEKLGEKLGLIADAGGGVAELARIGLGVGDEFLH